MTKATTFVEAFCHVTTSDQTYREPGGRHSGTAVAVGDVFVIQVVPAGKVYEYFIRNPVRGIHATL